MNFISWLKTIPKKEKTDDLMSETLISVFSFRIFLSAIAFLGIANTVYYIANYRYLDCLIGIAILIISAIFLLLSRYTKISFLPFVFNGALTLAMGVLYIVGIEGNEFMWFFIMPIANILILGMRYGSIYSFSTFLILLGLTFFGTFPLNGHEYTFDFKFKFILAYTCIYIVTLAYEYIQHLSLVNYRKVNHALQKNIEYQIKTKKVLSDISYQIRTPLNSIMGLLSVIQEDYSKEDQKKIIEDIHTSTQNLITVLEKFASFSGTIQDTENGKLIDFSKICDQIFKDFQEKFRHLTFKTNISFPNYLPINLIGNSDNIIFIIQEIIGTIITNRSKQSMVSIDIYIDVFKENNNSTTLLFEIHTSSIKNLFHKVPENASLDESSQLLDLNMMVTNKQGYASINLQTAKQIIEANNGKMGIAKPNEDITSFWFTNTFWKHDKNNENHIEYLAKTKDPIVLKKIQDIKDADVLIVEDNLMNQQMVALILKKRVGNIHLANNGKEAISMFSSTKIDIILMDLQLPLIDGFKATEKIREMEIGMGIHTPIIALTANAMDNEKSKCLDAGMDGYLCKPFNVQNLISEMELALKIKK